MASCQRDFPFLQNENRGYFELIRMYDEYYQNGKAEGKPRAREERKEAEMTESKGMRGNLIDTGNCSYQSHDLSRCCCGISHYS
jgi:hypothetical protein